MNLLSCHRDEIVCHICFDCEFTMLGDKRSRFVEAKQGVATANVVNLKYLVTPKLPGAGCLG